MTHKDLPRPNNNLYFFNRIPQVIHAPEMILKNDAAKKLKMQFPSEFALG